LSQAGLNESLLSSPIHRPSKQLRSVLKAFFPSALNLTVPNGNWHTTLRFEAGLNEVPDSLIDHWWLKANGVDFPTPIPVPDKAAPPSSRVRLPHLHALSEEINKLDLETEAEARGLIEKDIAEAQTQKATVLEQIRTVLQENCDAMRALAIKLDQITEA
jgi:hypothetical protein